MSNVVDWLLDDEVPEVKYRVMTELLGMSKSDDEVKKAYENLLCSKRLNLVMDKFKLGDKWENINALMALSEFGLTKNDVPIDQYLERIIKNIDLRAMKCAKILLLRNLVALGYDEHPWLKEQIPLAFAAIRQDGMIRCLDKTKKTNDSKLPDMGCYRQTTTYLLLACELKKKGVILPQFEQLVDFYLSHHVLFHKDDLKKVIIKEMAGTFYPLDHVHIGLQMIMYGLSVLGKAGNPNCEEAWSLLENYKNTDNKYVLSDSFKAPYFDVGMIGKPNKWVTLYVLLAEKYKV
ncbi:MAG: hypothetical protein FWG91_10455 [Lachnospiraceae bacterium]|nr:hypothetical protein [Lachnospiraceae bacterium]